MSTVRFLLPLVLALATCWAYDVPDPIFDNVPPVHFDSTILEDYILPKDGIKPVSYNIKLQPYFDDAKVTKNKQFTFDGDVTIQLNVTENVENITYITLHAEDSLQFTLVELHYELLNKTEGEKVPKYDNIIVKPEDTIRISNKNFIKLRFNEILINETRNYYLTFKYNGTLKQEDLRGFYRSSYMESDEQKWLATTHFEPIGARRAFPCWDEPEIKATFNITITHPTDYSAISNMKIKEEKQLENKTIIETTFETTPSMSTYLVAFVVSQYESVPENKTESFKVWTRPDLISNADYALRHGQKVLNALEDYTGIKYGEKVKKDEEAMNMKIDQISIPDFRAGAMENWGLVTYRESALLYEENVTITRTKQDIATVISHEFSHQWFGNLVTPKWWKYIWLNEGFATFFQYFTTEEVINNDQELSWRLMEQFVVKVLQESAFVSDASSDTHPLNQDAERLDKINDLFDDISYKKGASVIRMMQHFLTEQIFQNGLKLYLEDNKYGSVTPEKLFQAMQTAYDKSNSKSKPKLPKYRINDIMAPWVNEPGYPILNVGKSEKGNDLTLTQERFYLIKPSTTEEPKFTWYIPINYIVEGPPNYTTVATEWMDTAKMIVKNEDASKWVIFNNLQTGYYRVNYNDANWELLAKYLNSDKFNELAPVTRAQLLDDSLNLARAGYLTYTTALKFTLYLDKENDYIPWYTVARNFDYIDRMLQNMSNHDTLQKYVAQKIKKFVDTVELSDTPNNGTHIFNLGRELALTTACRYGQEDCVKYAEARLKKWLDDKNPMPIDLRDGIICAGLRKADQATWNTTLEMYKNSTDEKEKVAILKGLGCVQNEEIIETFLQLSLNDKFVINIFDAMNTICQNNLGSFDLLLDFIRNNFETLKKKKNFEEEFAEHIGDIANRITSKEQYGKMTLFLVSSYVQGLEVLLKGKDNLDWIERNQQNISEWLTINYKENKGNYATPINAFLLLIPVLISRFY